MRYDILDDLVDPLTGGSLCVENAEVVQRQNPESRRCERWCGRLCRSATEVDPQQCRACLDEWIELGELVRADDPSVRYPITKGIPRLLPSDAIEGERWAQVSAITQERFGYDWAHSSKLLPEYDEVARAYFALAPPETLTGAVVLDAGCGMGRWAHCVGKQGVRRLYALDFSRAIDRAADTLADLPEAHCVQADVRFLPFRPGTFDFIYSLGVQHHLPDPDAGMSSLVRRLKPDGSLLVYLSYALDNRPLYHRLLLRSVTLIRIITSRLPKPLIHRLSHAIGLMVYWPLARLARALERCGAVRTARQMPQAFYHGHSLRLMIADAFDRFATPIEKRYSRGQIQEWLAIYAL